MEANSAAAAGGVNGELPEELLREVLSKLPVKSLCRFRCVSKLWCSVISDPLFVDAHRACSGDRPELLIASQWESSIRSWGGFPPFLTHTELYSTPYPLRRSTDRAVQTLALVGRSIFFRPPIMSHQVGGLYCLDTGDFVRICNPATGETYDLGTVFNPLLMRRTESNTSFWSCITNHFGFDPVERKHKVISIWGEPYFECYVFVLEDNYWTKIPDNYPREYSRPPRIDDVVCVDGVVFSAPNTGSSSSSNKQILVAFDVRTETFRVIQHLPDPQWPWDQTRLIELGGRVAILSRDRPVHRYEPSNIITLWVLEDLSWRCKDCTIQLGEEFCDSEELVILGGMRAGELMLAPRSCYRFMEDSFLLIYNVDSNSVRRIELQGVPRGHMVLGSCFNFLRFHVESLQSPKPKHPF